MSDQGVKLKCPLSVFGPPASTPEEKRDETFYFKDGSIVLSAHQDNDNNHDSHNLIVYFRVHMTLLAKESTIFADLLNLPTPANGDQDTYDGVPLVKMSDNIDHLRGFLLAIYEPHSVFQKRFSDGTVRALLGPLTLAIKYEASALKERAIAHIKRDWPAENYQLWKLKEKELGVFNERPTPELLINLSWATSLREELRLPIALAYYSLCCSPIEAYIATYLKVDDLMIMQAGRRDMESWLHKHILDGTGNPPLNLCVAECMAEKFRIALLFKAMKLKDLDLLSCWEARASLVDGYHQFQGLCDSRKCRQSAVNWLRGLTAKAFDKIPKFFVALAEGGSSNCSSSHVGMS